MGESFNPMFWLPILVALGVVLWVILGKKKQKQKEKLLFTYFGNEFIKIQSTQMATIFKSDQNATFQVAPVDRKGRPAKVQEGSVEYSIDDSSVATVEEDPTDETKFKVVSSAEAITEAKLANVTVSADADTGDGIKTVTGVLAIVVEPDGAEGFGITTLTEPADNNP